MGNRILKESICMNRKAMLMPGADAEGFPRTGGPEAPFCLPEADKTAL